MERRVGRALVGGGDRLAVGVPPMAGIDIQAGLALLQNDEARYRRWLGEFLTQAPAAVGEIQRALAAGEPEPASLAAHTLKGRTGLLGMTQLHAVASALEAAIDGAAPAGALAQELEQGVAEVCTEIRRALGVVETAVAPGEPLPPLPGPPPASVLRLLAGLRAGEADCDALAADCLAELGDSEWAPRLRQAQIHIQSFDYAASIRLLVADRAQLAQGG